MDRGGARCRGCVGGLDELEEMAELNALGVPIEAVEEDPDRRPYLWDLEEDQCR